MYCKRAIAGVVFAVAAAFAQMGDMNPAGMAMMNMASRTSANPVAWATPMIMKPAGSGSTMSMGVVFLSEIQQGGSRGHDKLYSINWQIAMAQHRVAKKGAFQAVVMLS